MFNPYRKRRSKLWSYLALLVAVSAVSIGSAYHFKGKTVFSRLTPQLNHPSQNLAGLIYQRITKCPKKGDPRLEYLRQRGRPIKPARCFDLLTFHKNRVEASDTKSLESFAYWADGGSIVLSLELKKNGKFGLDGRYADKASAKEVAANADNLKVQFYSVRNDGTLLQGPLGGVYRKIAGKSVSSH